MNERSDHFEVEAEARGCSLATLVERRRDLNERQSDRRCLPLIEDSS